MDESMIKAQFRLAYIDKALACLPYLADGDRESAATTLYNAYILPVLEEK